MDEKDTKVRLYVEQPLGEGQAVALDPGQARYIFAVMRLGVGSGLRLFNGRDGEWRARLIEGNKKRALLLCEERLQPQLPASDLWLAFAPLRKERTNFVVEKAVELGVSRLLPVHTRFTATHAERWRPDRQNAHAIEAAEQCGALCVPSIAALQPLAQMLAGWPEERWLLWADEALPEQNEQAAAPLWGAGKAGMPRGPAALLIGPEGGFSPEERTHLRTLPFVRPLALGPRILRAETAAIAALVLWQSAQAI